MIGLSEHFVKRGRFEIVYEILTMCREPMLKTHIMYGCNLSSTQLERYLTLLVSRELLEVFNGEEKRLYRATSKGLKFIAHYKHVTSLITTDIREPVTLRRKAN